MKKILLALTNTVNSILFVVMIASAELVIASLGKPELVKHSLYAGLTLLISTVFIFVIHYFTQSLDQKNSK